MTKPRRKRKKASKKDVRFGRALPPSVFPAHLGVSTPEEWRAFKRTQWREVMQALQRYGYGSAYTPASVSLFHLSKLCEQVQEALEAPNWIAW